VAGRSGTDIVLDVVNVSSQPRETWINLEGASHLAESAQETVLSSAGADDENTLGEPPKVAPVTRSIAVTGTNFIEIFPPNSLTIIRLKTQ
jgi:alpha-L-arabinofuranosidase